MEKCKYSLLCCFWIFLHSHSLALPPINEPLDIFEAEDIYHYSLYNEAAVEFSNIIYEHAVGPHPAHQKDLAIEISKLFKISSIQYEHESIDVSELEGLINKHNDTHPITNTLYQQIGDYYFHNSQYEKAIDAYISVQASSLTDKQRSKYYFRLGYIHFQQAQYNVAEKYFKFITNQVSVFKDASLYYTGYIKYIQKKYEEAIWHISQMSRIETPVSAFIYYLRALDFFEKRDYEKTLDMARIKIDADKRKIDPYTPYFHRMSALVRFKMKGFYEATKHYQALYRFRGAMTENDLYNWGLGLYFVHDWKKAIQIFSKIKVENTFFQHSQYMIGNCYLQLNEPDKALPYFIKAMTLHFNPSVSQVAQYQSIMIWNQIKDGANMEHFTKDYLVKYPKSKKKQNLILLLCDYYLKNRKHDMILHYVNQLDDTDETAKIKQKIYFHIGAALYQEKEYKDALTYLSKSLQYEWSKSITAQANLYVGEILYVQKKYRKAREAFLAVLKTTNEKTIINYANIGLGYTIFHSKNYTTALRHFLTVDKSLLNKEERGEITLKLADIYFASKAYSKSLKEYNEYIDTYNKEQEYAMIQKGIILGRLNKIHEKINLFNELIEQHNNSPRRDYMYYQLALTHFKISAYTNAETYFDKLLSETPNSKFAGNALLHKAYIQFNQGRNQAAADILKKVITTYKKEDIVDEATELLKNIYIYLGKPKVFFSFIKGLKKGKHIENKEVEFNTIYESILSTYQSGNHTQTIENVDVLLNDYNMEDIEQKIELRKFRVEASLSLQRRNKAKEDIFWLADSCFKPTNKRRYKKEKATCLLQDSLPQEAIKTWLEVKDIDPQDSLTIHQEIFNAAHAFSLSKQAKRYGHKLVNNSMLNIESKTNIMFNLIHHHKTNKERKLSIKHMKWVKSKIGGRDAARATYETAKLYFDNEELEQSKDVIDELLKNYGDYTYFKAKGLILMANIYAVREQKKFSVEILKSIIRNYKQEDEIVSEAKATLKTIQE